MDKLVFYVETPKMCNDWIQEINSTLEKIRSSLWKMISLHLKKKKGINSETLLKPSPLKKVLSSPQITSKSMSRSFSSLSLAPSKSEIGTDDSLMKFNALYL
jgi:hypothetical protein